MATTQPPAGSRGPGGVSKPGSSKQAAQNANDKLAVRTAVPGTADPRAAAPNASVDELRTRLGRIGDDRGEDAAELLAGSWQRLLGTVAVVMLLVWVFSLYRSSAVAKKGETGELLVGVQESYAKLRQLGTAAKSPEAGETPKPAEDPKRIDALRALTDNIELLETHGGRTFYGQAAALYTAASQAELGHYEEAKRELEKFTPRKFADIRTARSARDVEGSDIVSELAALQLARIELAEGKAPIADVRALLTGLVNGARFVSVEALVALARLAETDADRQAVQATATQFLAARPEAREAVEQDLEELGITVTNR